MGRKANKPEDVWRYVERRGADECWPWVGTMTPSGYGVFAIKHRGYPPHRIVLWLSRGGDFPLLCGKPRKDSIFVLHSCDNKICCNPSHLRAGTPQDNMTDKVVRGRLPNLKGENGGGSKLRNEDASRIREACLFGAKQKELAALYGISRAAVCLIVKRNSYADVPP